MRTINKGREPKSRRNYGAKRASKRGSNERCEREREREKERRERTGNR